MSTDILKLHFHRPFQKEGIVVVVSEDTPSFITFSHEGLTEHISVQFAGHSATQEEKCDLRTAVMETLKCMWLYKHRNSRRVKKSFEEPDQSWAGDLTGSDKHAVQSKLDHNLAAFTRLKLDRRGVIEDLWCSANEQAPTISPQVSAETGQAPAAEQD